MYTAILKNKEAQDNGSAKVTVEFSDGTTTVTEAVVIKGSKGGTNAAGTFAMEVWQGGSNPTAGTLVASQVFSTADLDDYNTTPTMQVLTYDQPTAVLPAGKYYLIVHILTGSGNDVIRWSTNNYQTYEYGNRWYGTTGWTSQPSIDFNFAIYGQ